MKVLIANDSPITSEQLMNGIDNLDNVEIVAEMQDQKEVVEAVHGLEEVGSDPRVSELELEFEPGDEILVPPEGFEFLGYVSVHAGTPTEAAEALEEVYGRVRFDVRPIRPVPAPSLLETASP